jgi:polyphosphate kinase 2 (PPK2 family)
VVGIAAPTDEERAQHYLWRFWRHLPRAGFSTFFDRSWYGRVLVERVEGFAPPGDWGRAYGEITDFEAQMAEQGIIVNKFWVHISPQEQLKRFRERQRVDYKQYKITEEDWRNREKWPAYALAIDDMVTRTSTEVAPWTLISGNDKKFARVQILKTLVKRLEAEL